MASATKLPKLRWVDSADSSVVRDEKGEALWMVLRSNVADVFGERLWAVCGQEPLGYARTVEEAKAIAQAFADSEAARKGGKP